jgi:hypothetical protein
MRYAGSAAALNGISMEETAAMIGKLRDRGLEASQAGTTFRMALAQLYKETDKGTEALAKYGLTYKDLNPSVNSVAEIIGKFEGKTITAKDAVDIFGVRAQIMGGIINDGRESFESYTQSVTGTTAAYDAMQKKAETWTVVQNQIIGSTDQFKKSIANGLMPEILHFIGTTPDEGIRGIIVMLTDLEKKYGGLGDSLSGAFEGLKGIFDDTFSGAFTNVEGLYNFLVKLGVGLSENLQLVAEWASMWFQLGVESTDSMDMIKFGLHAANSALAAVGFVISGIHDTIAAFYNGWLWYNSKIEGGFWKLSEVVGEAMLFIAKALDSLPFINLESQIESLEGKVVEWGLKAADAFNPDYMKYWSDDVAKTYYNIAEGIVNLKDPAQAISNVTKATYENTYQMAENLKAAEKAMLANADAAEVVEGKVISTEDRYKKNLALIEDMEKKTSDVGEETAKVEQLWYKVGNEWKSITVTADETKESVESTSKAVKDMSDNEFKLHLEQFKADTEQAKYLAEFTHKEVMANIEWKAKLDIEEVIANKEVLKAAFESIGKAVEATAQAASSMFSDFANFEGSMGDKWFLQDILEEQMRLQAEAIESQKLLTEAEVAYLEAKTEALRDRDADHTIEVQVMGETEPWLKGLMESLFKELILKARNEPFQIFGE